MSSQLPGSSTGGSLKERLLCTVCKKLLVDAVVLNECRHIYCRACLLGHLDREDRCADCLTHLGPNKTAAFRPDPTLQDLVYKLTPQHYYQEVRYRKEFAARRRLQGVERRLVMDRNFTELARYLCKEEERIPVNLI
uniref:RING-type domain-containing protein n=1 Tax=Steinernema glaseri TaxID=37863 RepID=A0A1I8AHC5_9BILA